MGRSESGLFSYSEPVVPPTTSIDYVLMHTGYMGPRKLSSFDGR
jgi:hypothetical protein